MFIILLVSLVSFLYCLKLYLYGNDDYWPKQGIPFSSSSEIGRLWDRVNFRIPLHELDNTAYKKFKSLKGVKFGGIMEFRHPIAFLMDLDLIRLVLVKDFEHFQNHRRLGRKDDPTLVHKMLFSMENAEWKDLRAAMTPTFTTGKIKRMCPIFLESSKKLEVFLREELNSASQVEIDLQDAFGRYSMDVIASAAFGVDTQNFDKNKDSTFAEMGKSFQAHFSGFLGSFRLFTSMWAPGIYKLFSLTAMDPISVNFFTDVIRKAIRHREGTGEKRNDFLQLILEAKSGELKSEDGSSSSSGVVMDDYDKDAKLQDNKISKVDWTDELVAAQAVAFIFGGFDAVETLLSYAAYELALNPEIQDRLYEEIRNAVLEETGELSYDVVNQMEYLDMVISETLRKYPLAVRTDRKCTNDYKVPGTRFEIKKNTVVAIPVWSIHHDHEIYPRPDKFLPERFSVEGKAKRHPFAYMPFGIGSRSCIARRFALIEGKATIAHLVLNFRLTPSPKTTIPMKYTSGGNLKPAHGMWLTVTSRC